MKTEYCVPVDDDEPTQQVPAETLAACAAYHRAELAKQGLVDAETPS